MYKTGLPPLDYNAPRELRAFLESRGLGMRKKLGQNFLINPRVREQLVSALDPPPDDTVWEIGAGLGAMTALLLERGVRLSAFEVDPGFIRALKEFFGDEPRFTLIEGDVLKTWPSVQAAPFLLGNLPYNIGAALLGDLIEGGRFFTRMVVTVQKEVACRMLARPGGKEYSSFSVLSGSVYRIRSIVNIKASSFYPVPHVDSQGLCLDLIRDTSGAPPSYPKLLYPLVRGLFASRRKTVKNNLSVFIASRLGRGEAAAVDALEKCRIRPDERAENLGLAEFVLLAHYLEDNYEQR